MTTLDERLRQAEAKVESLKAELRDSQYTPNWKPKSGDDYYFINDEGDIDNYILDDGNVGTYRLRANNVFKTRAEARMYLKIFNRVHELNDRDPVVCDDREDKYFFYYDGKEEKTKHAWGTGGLGDQGKTYMTEATMNTIHYEFAVTELEVWVRR